MLCWLIDLISNYPLIAARWRLSREMHIHSIHSLMQRSCSALCPYQLNKSRTSGWSNSTKCASLAPWTHLPLQPPHSGVKMVSLMCVSSGDTRPTWVRFSQTPDELLVASRKVSGQNCSSAPEHSYWLISGQRRPTPQYSGVHDIKNRASIIMFVPCGCASFQCFNIMTVQFMFSLLWWDVVLCGLI